MKLICENCEHMVVAQIGKKEYELNCLYGIKSMDVIKCTHFKAK